jgi:glucose/arabinose dehydrogenase
LKAEKVADGLESPTAFAFKSPNDILVLEKDKGTVLRILDGKVLPEPVLDVNVANQVEQGLLGIAVSKNPSDERTYVFLYYTEGEPKSVDEGEDDDSYGEE